MTSPASMPISEIALYRATESKIKSPVTTNKGKNLEKRPGMRVLTQLKNAFKICMEESQICRCKTMFFFQFMTFSGQPIINNQVRL